MDYLKYGSATVDYNMLFLVYPCQAIMWLFVLSAFLLKKDGWFARLVKDYTFLAGTVCATFGTVLNDNYKHNPDITDYFIFKGLLSHSVLVMGCILLFTSGYVKIRVGGGCAAMAVGLTFFFIDGTLINWLFDLCGLPSCNAMCLARPFFPSLPWINFGTVCIVAMLLTFLLTATVEQCTLRPEERWYRRLSALIKSRKQP